MLNFDVLSNVSRLSTLENIVGKNNENSDDSSTVVRPNKLSFQKELAMYEKTGFLRSYPKSILPARKLHTPRHILRNRLVGHLAPRPFKWPTTDRVLARSILTFDSEHFGAFNNPKTV